MLENREVKKMNSRPIIVRFSNFRTRQEVFFSKKKLKGDSVSITENLTAKKIDLLKKANAKFGKGKCWSSEGRIFTKSGVDLIHIASVDDL